MTVLFFLLRPCEGRATPAEAASRLIEYITPSVPITVFLFVFLRAPLSSTAGEFLLSSGPCHASPAHRPGDTIPTIVLAITRCCEITVLPQVAGYDRAEQPWYICQECDADWKGDMEMFRVCVACARNCHKGRLGHRTRFCKLSNTRCMCCERGEGCCLYFSKKVRRMYVDVVRRTDAPAGVGCIIYYTCKTIRERRKKQAGSIVYGK